MDFNHDLNPNQIYEMKYSLPSKYCSRISGKRFDTTSLVFDTTSLSRKILWNFGFVEWNDNNSGYETPWREDNN